jgi:hypothetical protein
MITQEEYLNIVKIFESELEFDFPNEHLGVADRFLWNNIVRDAYTFWREHEPRKIIHANLAKLMLQNAKKYEFNTRELGEWD